jgi:hypothetical protein
MYRRSVAALLVALIASQADAREFGGYFCGDCSGHKAGYEWAETREVKSTRQCEEILRRWPNRQSFYEGCLVYIKDPTRGPGHDDSGEEIDYHPH